jgi:PAS domain S-box-containing protein
MAGQTVIFETTFIRKDGTRFPVEITQSTLSLGDELFILGIDRDITELKNAQKQLQENIHFLTTLLETIPLPVVYKDKNRRFLGCNTEFEQLIGKKREELIGKTVFDIYPYEYAKRYDEADQILLKNGVTQKMEEQIIDARGDIRDIILTKAVFTDVNNEIAGYILILFDITERKNFEIRLLETIITTEEKERERFAGNLHDEVGPLLSSLKMYLSLLAESEDKKKKDYIIGQVQHLIKEAIQTVREISNDLSPHILNNYGCIAAINSYIALKSDFIQIDFSQNIDNRRLGAHLETIIYRITKELINNTLKHAEAKKIDLKIMENGNFLNYYYHDDGKGFEMKDSIESKSGSIGLLNIVSRVKTINGRYQIKSSPGKGFTFELEVPLK